MFNDVLNEDCVLHIFSFLSPVDILTVEEVCNKWRNWAQVSWRFITKVDDNLLAEFSTIDDEKLTKILQRCGSNIETFERKFRFDIYISLYIYIAEYCPNIQSVKLESLDIEHEMYFLLMSFTKLRLISIFKMYNDNTDDIFSKIFINNPYLETVKLPLGFNYTDCLTYLPERVKVLRLLPIENLEAEHVAECLKKCCNLHTVCINECYKWTGNSLTELATATPNLKQLTIKYCRTPLTHIQGWKHLQRLYLFDISIDDNLLEKICTADFHLEIFGLGGKFHKFTKNGLSCLKNLTDLQELILSYVGTAINQNCDFWPTDFLKVFRVHKSYTFNNEIAFRVVRSCPNLKCFDMYECGITSDAVANTVLALEKQIYRQTPLTVKVTSWNFDYEDASKYKHPMMNFQRSSLKGDILSIVTLATTGDYFYF